MCRCLVVSAEPSLTMSGDFWSIYGQCYPLQWANDLHLYLCVSRYTNGTNNGYNFFATLKYSFHAIEIFSFIYLVRAREQPGPCQDGGQNYINIFCLFIITFLRSPSWPRTTPASQSPSARTQHSDQIPASVSGAVCSSCGAVASLCS